MSPSNPTKDSPEPAGENLGPFDPSQLSDIVFNEQGLVPAIVQDVHTKAVLMLAWMTRDTLTQSLAQRRTVFWSRSRQEVWRKGDTSGDIQVIHDIAYDCDGDVLLIQVDQHGAGACHTGAYSCFFRSFAPADR